MAQACPSCGALNRAAAEVCFTCRAVLTRITLGSVIASRYELRRLLGRGGMGTVYLAHDRVLEETVALKILRSDLAELFQVTRRFRSEIKLARRVTHPNVCRIHDYGEDEGIHYISMELVCGPDLRQVVEAAGPLPVEQAYETVVQLARGLEAIHRLGIVHRDIKTRNIMLDADGLVKLMDFGIAKRVGPMDAGMTASGQIVGTPEYMSPEQVRGERIDARSDIYAVGIVAYEVFTGSVPFRDDTDVSVLLKQMNTPPPLEGPAAARLPPLLVPVLRRLLAKEPAERFATAGEMVQAIQAARERGRESGPPVPSLADLARAYSPLSALADDRLSLPDAETESWAGRGEGSPGRDVLAARREPETGAARERGPLRVLAVLLLLTGGGWLAVRATTPPPRSWQPPPLHATAAPARPRPTPQATPGAAVSKGPRATPSATRRYVRAVPPTVRSAEPTPKAAPEPGPDAPSSLSSPSSGLAGVGEASAGAALGLLQVGVRPYADVAVDGTLMGTTPLKALALPAGPHTVVLTHPDYLPLKRKVTVVAGQRLKLIVDLSLDGIRR